MAQSQADDDSYGVPDPNEVLTQQRAEYARAVAAGPSSSGLAGGLALANINDPRMSEAKAVQMRMRDILAQANKDAPENEDPITKQMRIAAAMQGGLADISPSAAMAAGGKLVQLSQMRHQQTALDARTRQETAEAEAQEYKNTVLKNTPQTFVLAQDNGTDPTTKLPALQTVYKSYDANDPNSIVQMRADVENAKQQGISVTPMTIKDFNDSRTQAAIARSNAQVQAAMIAAAQRAQTAELKAQQTGQKDDHMVDRIMTAADMGATQLANIADMNFGVSSGYFPKVFGATGPGSSTGTSLMATTKANLYNTLTPEDAQLYNAMAANLYRPLSILEAGGGIQGGQRMSDKIEAALTIRPTDAKLTILTKLAETRQIIESGTDIYMNARSTDPGVKEALRAKLDRLQQSIPWTPLDVIKYKKSLETNPQMTFGEFAQSLRVPGAAARAQAMQGAMVTPPERDSNGTAAIASF